MSDLEKGISITKQVNRQHIPTTLAVTFAEVIKNSEENARSKEEAGLRTSVPSSVFRSVQRLLTPVLDLNVRVSGDVDLLGNATKEDLKLAVFTVAESAGPDVKISEILQFNKVFIESTEVDGRQIVLCTFVPRGLIGVLTDSGLLKKKIKNASSKKEKLAGRFISTGEVSEVLKEVKVFRETRDSESLVEQKKPIVIIQGLQELSLKGKVATDQCHNGSEQEGKKAHAVFLFNKSRISTLAHELAHTFHKNVKGEEKNFLFIEGDATLAELEVYPQEIDDELNARNCRYYKQYFESASGLPFNSELVEKILLTEPRNIAQHIKRDSELLRNFGFILAKKVVAEYGREYWDVVVKEMISSNKKYERFLLDSQYVIDFAGKRLTSKDCFRMIAEGINEAS